MSRAKASPDSKYKNFKPAKGNSYAAKDKVWMRAINEALETYGLGDRKKALQSLATKLIDMCMEGNMDAIKEMGNRLDGKPAQAIHVDGEVKHSYDSIIAQVLNEKLDESTTDRSSKETLN